MIVHKKFIWLHFPKCAGTKIERLFSKYLSHLPELEQDVIDPAGSFASWHDSIAARKARNPNFKPKDRIIICSFRQLPSWIESRYSFEKTRNPELPHNPNDLLTGHFLEANGYRSHADYYPKKYLPESLLENHAVRFLRTEFFEYDFKSIFGDFLDLSNIPESEYQSKENCSVKNIPEGIKEALNNDSSIYKHCPYWKKIEDLAYG